MAQTTTTRKQPNASAISRLLRKSGYWVISNQSGRGRSGIRVVQTGRGVLTSVSVRLWVWEMTDTDRYGLSREIRELLAGAGYKVDHWTTTGAPCVTVHRWPDER